MNTTKRSMNRPTRVDRFCKHAIRAVFLLVASPILLLVILLGWLAEPEQTLIEVAKMVIGVMMGKQHNAR